MPPIDIASARRTLNEWEADFEERAAETRRLNAAVADARRGQPDTEMSMLQDRVSILQESFLMLHQRQLANGHVVLDLAEAIENIQHWIGEQQ